MRSHARPTLSTRTFGFVTAKPPPPPKRGGIHPYATGRQRGATGASLGTGVAVTGGVLLTGVLRAGLATALVQYLTREKLSTKQLLTLFGVLSAADVALSGLGIAAVYGATRAATDGTAGS